jgi:glycosyltransferase involved in cell wall biosynthesis
MSVMDLSYLYFPELFRKKDLIQLTEWTKYSVHKASAVLTISEYSKNDIIKRYGKSETAVHVTYPGLSMPTQKKDPTTVIDIFKKYSLPERFILSVGTIQPRKNYEKLIEAFSLFLKADPKKNGDIDLVIIGKKGWLFEGILRSSETHGVSAKVKFLDFVPDGELPTFYRSANCFALPSLYEGFGLPVLEAMANDCPVVVSNVSSLPEIAGDAGIYVDPSSAQDIASGLAKAVRQRTTSDGISRIQAGRKQVQRFTWEKAAKQTLQVLEQVAAKGI